MRLFLLLFLLVPVISCSTGDSNQIATSPKGPNLRITQEYENVKSLANAVRVGVLDSCISKDNIGFDEMVTITPKMFQLMKHAAYKTKTCDFVNNKLGDISEWNLAEAFKSDDHLLKIFRYRLIPKKLDFPVELRITFTDRNKLTEYRFFKWKENYSEDLILMDWN